MIIKQRSLAAVEAEIAHIGDTQRELRHGQSTSNDCELQADSSQNAAVLAKSQKNIPRASSSLSRWNRILARPQPITTFSARNPSHNWMRPVLSTRPVFEVQRAESVNVSLPRGN